MIDHYHLDPENIDDFLIALAAHEVRHVVIRRGLARHFTPQTIGQLHALIAPPEEAEFYINTFYNFMQARGDPEEADAHMVELIVYHNLPYIQDFSELRDFILISPQ